MLSMDPGAPLSMEELGAVRNESELRKEVEELRREVAALRFRTDSSAPREALLEERSNREMSEGSLRQMSAKLEETLARETVALRADNADLRSSLTEALRLLADERTQRQADVLDNTRRQKDFQAWAEEKTQRLESMARSADARVNDNKQGVAEVERLRDLTEFRAIAAVAEEGRNREAALQAEQQAREALCAEVEARLRGVISDEKQIRSKATDDLMQQVRRLEEAVRCDRELNGQRQAEAMTRIEETLRGVYEEGRRRQADFTNLGLQVEDIRNLVKTEARDRADGDENNFKRTSSVEAALESFMDRCESELASLRQGTAELRAACQVEATVREEGVARLHSLLDEEARAREEANVGEASARDQANTRMEQHVRAVISEQRQAREDTEGELDQKVAALQHEHNFEKAKAAAQARELAQAVAQAREAITAETTARRHEVNLVVRGLDEVREGITDLTSSREKSETRLQEQLNTIDRGLREECSSREAIERKALAERTELQDGVQRVARSQHELEISCQNAVTEERRLREESMQREIQTRDEADAKLSATVQELVQAEAASRDKEARVLERRLVTLEQARTVDLGDREEEKRNAGIRMNTLGDNLGEARAEMRKALQKCDDFAALRETLLSESAARQSQERSLEMAVKEQEVKIEQVQRTRESAERRLESKLTDMGDRLDSEAHARNGLDAKYAKQISDFSAEHAMMQQTELRRLEEIVARAQKALESQAFEDRCLREKSFSTLEQKTLELREGVDEVRKWRVEQYNELILEITKLTEMVSEEAKARQQQDQVLEGHVNRLREETNEEANTRKFAIGGMQDEVKDVLTRLERERESVVQKERERWRAIETLRDDLLSECVKREACDGELRQAIDKEVLVREEVLQGASRAWQKASGKINEDWRAALRSDAALREEATLRLEQQIVEIRTKIEESRAMAAQRDEDVRMRFQANADALQGEEVARKTEDLLVKKEIENLAQALQGEQTERGSNDQHTAERFAIIENNLRDEGNLRELTDRNFKQELIDLGSRLQQEQAAREESEMRIEQRINAETDTREDAVAREIKSREDGDAVIMEAWQKNLREEQSIRERDRKDMVSRVQLMQGQLQEEHEELVKAKRELVADVARLQSLCREEEESRNEQCERLAVQITTIQETVSVLQPQREEILKKAMKELDEVRGLVNKEVVARTTRSETLDDTLRDIRSRLNEEVQNREHSVRSVEDKIMEEVAAREDALGRERRATEEELQKALQNMRRSREDEARKVQERLLEVSSAINEERDLRTEALRQERQKSLDNKESLAREQKAMDREIAKQAQQVLKLVEGDAQRAKELDMLLNSLNEKCETNRIDLVHEVQRRQGQLENLEKQMLETSNQVGNEMKSRCDMGEDLKKAIAEEARTREEVSGTDRRAREAGDLQVANALKAALRDEREARESETAVVAKEVNTVKAQLADETGRREDERSQQSLAIQKIRSEISELLSERKVDVVAMKEAFSQVTDELKVVQRTRKEDVDRIDGFLSSVSSRVDGNARTARDQCVTLEQSIHVLQSELQQEVDERTSWMYKLDARISEERRSVDGSIAAAMKGAEESIHLADEASRVRWAEEARKQKALLDQLELQISNLMGDLEKGRTSGSEQARELARGIAALQGSLSAEEQARQQSAWHLQQGIDAVREEIAAEGKERRIQSTGTKDDIENVQRLIQQRDERTDANVQKLSAEAADLRDKLARELRQREAAVSQVEQRLLSFQAVKDGTPGAMASIAIAEKAPPAQVPQDGPTNAQWREFQRNTDEDLMKQKRQVDGLIAEQQVIGKSMGALSERIDALKTGLAKVESAAGETQSKNRVIGDLELQVRMSREDLSNEAKERRAEYERVRGSQAEIVERFESSEQKRLAVESDLRQELMDGKGALKKEMREREVAVAKIASSVREETQKREEAIEREERARQEAQQRASDQFTAALREERRIREKENLRMENVPISVPMKSGYPAGDGGQEVSLLQMDCKQMRLALGEVQDRLAQTEMRQKSAEERTVSMLDTIMSGLTSPGD